MSAVPEPQTTVLGRPGHCFSQLPGDPHGPRSVRTRCAGGGWRWVSVQSKHLPSAHPRPKHPRTHPPAHSSDPVSRTPWCWDTTVSEQTRARVCVAVALWAARGVWPRGVGRAGTEGTEGFPAEDGASSEGRDPGWLCQRAALGRSGRDAVRESSGHQKPRASRRAQLNCFPGHWSMNARRRGNPGRPFHPERLLSAPRLF